MPEQTELISVSEAAALLKMRRETVARWADSGRLMVLVRYEAPSGRTTVFLSRAHVEEVATARRAVRDLTGSSTR